MFKDDILSAGYINVINKKPYIINKINDEYYSTNPIIYTSRKILLDNNISKSIVKDGIIINALNKLNNTSAVIFDQRLAAKISSNKSFLNNIKVISDTDYNNFYNMLQTQYGQIYPGKTLIENGYDYSDDILNPKIIKIHKYTYD